uniref:Glycosyltransferase n=1 Tax=viral metagenome TaxID=1070528 RepID=A0A6C0K3X5_9ZZZZ
MIPKIIHQTYKQEDNLPLVYKECQTIIRSLHADWTYMFWTDEKMYAEVKESFPDLYEVFMKLPRKIMQIDVFRYCLMWKYGGLYADLDYKMRKAFDILDAELVLPMSRMPTAKQAIRFGNCIFASRPGHPFWKFVLDDIIQNPAHLEIVTDSDVMDSENGTGPGFVTRMYLTCPPEISQSITTPGRYTFHPPSSYGDKELGKNDSYGVHLCESVWTKGRL